MLNNILADIKIKDIKSGAHFTVYFGCNGTQYIIHEDSIGFESEPMEVTLTINYHQKTNISYNPFIDEEFVMVDKINIKMHMHNRHIDVELENTLDERKNKHQQMYLWGHISDAPLSNIYQLRYIMDKCYRILDKMDFSSIMSFGNHTGKSEMILHKSIIHGIVTAKNQEFAERCLEYHCGNDMAFLWNDINQDSFDESCHADFILIEELVENNRPDLLRMIPLRLRIMLVTHFNAEGKHEIVAALNHYHRGDYKNPGKDLVL
jgi:hypothetical protein